MGVGAREGLGARAGSLESHCDCDLPPLKIGDSRLSLWVSSWEQIYLFIARKG